tara:strand:+ start:1134 stop:1259 length:126 start_codon:yes stop_codon:yes gene_type:complete
MGSGVAPSQKSPGRRFILSLSNLVNSFYLGLINNNGGRDKN